MGGNFATLLVTVILLLAVFWLAFYAWRLSKQYDSIMLKIVSGISAGGAVLFIVVMLAQRFEDPGIPVREENVTILPVKETDVTSEDVDDKVNTSSMLEESENLNSSLDSWVSDQTDEDEESDTDPE